MPTWRNWLGRETNKLGNKIDFTSTDFYKFWNELLNDAELNKFIETNNLEILFYPHINMQKYLKDFYQTNKNIKFLNTSNDIGEILKTSAILVTDYSSVFMDFAYMRKPIIFFQFDKDKYRQMQYKEGYFNYERDGFGPVLENVNEVVNYIKLSYKNDFETPNEYRKKMDNFFEINDSNNSERIYQLLMKGE